MCRLKVDFSDIDEYVKYRNIDTVSVRQMLMKLCRDTKFIIKIGNNCDKIVTTDTMYTLSIAKNKVICTHYPIIAQGSAIVCDI